MSALALQSVPGVLTTGPKRPESSCQIPDASGRTRSARGRSAFPTQHLTSNLQPLILEARSLAFPVLIGVAGAPRGRMRAQYEERVCAHAHTLSYLPQLPANRSK